MLCALDQCGLHVAKSGNNDNKHLEHSAEWIHVAKSGNNDNKRLEHSAEWIHALYKLHYYY